MKNLLGVLGWFCSPLAFEKEALGAGDPDNRTLLTDFLNALAIGVDNTEAKDVTFDKVFFLLLSPSPVVEFQALFSTRSPMSAFFRFRFR